MRILMTLTLLIMLAQPLYAQEAFEEFRWYEGNLALRYPVAWQNPTSVILDGYPALQITLDEARIAITRVDATSSDADTYALLDSALRDLGIQPTGPLPARLLDLEAISTLGTSADGLYYGLGRIVLTDGQIITITGRDLRENRQNFTSTFDTVANSLLLGADSLIEPLAYGVVWSIESYPLAGEDAFIDGRDLYIRDDNLYLLDAIGGIFIIDSTNGIVTQRIPLSPETLTPSSLALADDGTFYVGDNLCACIHRYQNGEWQAPIRGLSNDAPLHLAIGADGRLLATDWSAQEPVVRSFLGNGIAATYRFDQPLAQQPLIMVNDAGQLIAISDNGDVMRLEGNTFVSDYTLNATAFYIASTFTPEGNIAMATATQGILLFDAEGNVANRVGRIVSGFPMAGEIVAPNGITFGDDGTLYWLDSHGGFARLTAVRPDVESGRVGLSTLNLGDVRSGTLQDDRLSQLWTLDAQAGQTTQIRVVADGSGTLNPALRIIDPTGQEVLYQAETEITEQTFFENPLNVLVDTFTFNRSGVYTFIVERVQGEGAYTLGLTGQQRLPFDADNNQRVEIVGRIDEARTLQTWLFDAPATMNITITMISEDPFLDTLLRLYDANGNLLAENDNAEDGTLGLDARIARFALPRNATYAIHATRFNGTGNYRLILEVSQDEE